MPLTLIFAIVICYLIGAIPFALIIVRIAGGPDLRSVGSGNIGATNVWRTMGFKVAFWVFVCDIGKGVLAVLVARLFISQGLIQAVSPDYFTVVCAVAAILGHIFPVYIRFKGGKGVNTALGAVATMLPMETLVSFLVFVIVVAVSKYISLGSIAGAFSLFVVMFVEKYFTGLIVSEVYFWMSVVLAILIVLTHRSNIGRIVAGTEHKFSLSARGKGDAHV